MKANKWQRDLSSLPCLSLKGVGKKLNERLEYLGIQYVQDLLFYLPMRYQDRTRVYSIGDISPGDHVVIEGEVESVSTPRVGRTRLACKLRDTTGRIILRFFYVNTFQQKQFIEGLKVRCFGEVRYGALGLEMIHPEYHILAAQAPLPVDKNLTPIYPTTEGLSQQTWRKLTDQALQLLEQGALLHDALPEKILQKMQLPTLKEALQYVHRPPKDAPVDMLLSGKHHTQKRLVFEELLAHRLGLLHLKNAFQVQSAVPLPAKPILNSQIHSPRQAADSLTMGVSQGRDANASPSCSVHANSFSVDNLMLEFQKVLPFVLTSAQQRVINEIQKDLAKPHPMLRLVQGDVGSGKTVVAAHAVLQAIENGYQAAILAPTELLAEQHFNNFKKWFDPLGAKTTLLTGQLKAQARRAALEEIERGTTQVILGTHAIFQKGIQFAKLALIVVDEQHRFGVQQRALLRQKGIQDNHYPHQLIMTATPIPRTLAMSVYADLDYSIIDELPPGRTPISTLVISEQRRQEVLERIRNACTSGRQVYWVCTLIEESEVLQCTAAENTASELVSCFPELKIGLIHGRLKSSEKERVMNDFKEGHIQLLVATTVIEVGVDVPNASLMVIENAERLGLAQLHQLRGRVGRGAVASHCVLMYHSLSKLAKERLAVMRETTDGFKIAQRDMELRGPGEVLGTRQTGDVSLKIANLLRDSDLLPNVQTAATILENEYRESIDVLIKRWLGNKEKYGHV